MGLVVPDIAEVLLFGYIHAALVAAGSHLKLYKNNYTPHDASISADFTECDFSGYASAVPSFVFPVETANKALMVDTVARTFTHNGGGTANTVYGYYLIQDGTLNLLWAERFPASINMSASGNQISIKLQITLDSEFH